MDNETSKASFLGVGLTMIVAVIVLGLAVFAVARGIMNSAQTSFVQTMDGAANAGLSDYDGTTVSGVKVRSALEDYEGQNYMFLINTAALQKKSLGAVEVAPSSDSLKDPRKELVVREPYGSNNENLQMVQFSGRIYAIYNALVGTKTDSTGKETPDGKFEDSKEGYINFEGTFKTVDGLVQFNTQKINWKTSGCTEYISTSANFVCKLIKDPSGTIVGILFTEVY